MGKKDFNKKFVTISDETKFVLECYSAAITEAGFGENELDSRLLIKLNLLKSGFTNSLMAGLANFTHENYGHEFCELDPIRVTLVAHTDNFVSKYQFDWNEQIQKINRSKWLPTGQLNETEITCEKIYSPHILILHLTLRLFAFSLSEGEELKTDTYKYYTLLCHFTDKLKKHQSLLYESENKYDAVGSFLGGSHQFCLQNLGEVLKSKEHINLHQKACIDAEDLMTKIEEVIKRQICAYLNSSATVMKLDESYFNNHMDKCQKDIWELLLKEDDKDKQGGFKLQVQQC